VSGIFVPEIK